MRSVEWASGAEAQRDSLRLEMSPKRLERFEAALKQALEQIQMFEESAPIAPISRSGRRDVRQVVFGEGYRLIYVILPEHLLILSLLPPGSNQALD
ncbi:MAG: hypothetical protein N2Z75_07195 [Meiothermus sp.]|uniref:hypothetical protein n=1 Tax=Meiothermus sp. TaxID=1955249 RepID=UPI0025E0B6B7|nr:hypothetical protein [Meiothermus sp.]MCS7068107.1 hypothetical protein [Meiothermus sp.]MCX7601709.1 hypothetical protein [Meiothermus sp.]MDW8425591.1 hypothetical protein [Meiothermus sp.]